MALWRIREFSLPGGTVLFKIKNQNFSGNIQSKCLSENTDTKNETDRDFGRALYVWFG